MKLPRFRFSILSLLLLTAVIAVGVMLYQRHVVWKEAEAEYESLITQFDPSVEIREEVRSLLERYPVLAKKRGTMVWATAYGDLEMCETVLQQGADPNEAGSQLIRGSVLQFAILAKRTGLVRLLIEHEADLSIRDKNKGSSFDNSLLHTAAGRGDTAMCQLLLSEGLDIDAVNAKGQTPLHLAIKYAQIEVVQLLLEHGAACTKDAQGQTPRDVAQWRREEHVLAHLDVEPIDEMIRSIEAHCKTTDVAMTEG